MSRKTPIGAQGFTLIEMLVAICILGLLAVMGWRGLDSIVRARQALSIAMEQDRRMQLAFAQIETDCAHLADFRSVGGRTVLSAADGRLALVRVVYREGRPAQLQVVSYAVRHGVLTRGTSPATRDLAQLGRWWESGQNAAERENGENGENGDSAETVALQAGVRAMTMRTWSSESGAWRAGGNVAADAAPGRPPRESDSTGLEVRLQLAQTGATMTKVFLLGPV